MAYVHEKILKEIISIGIFHRNQKVLKHQEIDLFVSCFGNFILQIVEKSTDEGVYF